MSETRGGREEKAKVDAEDVPPVLKREGGAGEETTIDSDPELEAEMNYAKEHNAAAAVVADFKHRLHLADHRRTKSESGGRVVNGIVQVPRIHKNQRRSRTGRGKGLPKKNGGGGKWTWGASGKLYEEPEYIDSEDPNYDSDVQGKVKFESITPELTEEHLERYGRRIIEDYLENGDEQEAIDSIEDLKPSLAARKGLVRLLVTIALEKKASVRELASRLIAELVAADVVTASDVSNSLLRMICSDLEELSVDCPTAPEVVGKFIARAIADEAMPVGIFECLDYDPAAAAYPPPRAREALEHAAVLCQHQHRLDNIWGDFGSSRPVRILATKVRQILDEYLCSGDATEAQRCVLELDVPHFHHEVVYQAGVKAIESMHDRIMKQLAQLLFTLYKSSVLTVDAVGTGFQRLYEEMPDLSLDVPPAYTMLERWVYTCAGMSFVPQSIVRKMPQKGRKRFVSEGDGGRFKVIDMPNMFV